MTTWETDSFQTLFVTQRFYRKRVDVVYLYNRVIAALLIQFWVCFRSEKYDSIMGIYAVLVLWLMLYKWSFAHYIELLILLPAMFIQYSIGPGKCWT